MQRVINNIKLYSKENEISKNYCNVLLNELIKNNYKIVDNNFDLAISIGGDGTFLKMIHENMFNNSIYYIGINTGTLGFLPEINSTDILKIIDILNNNNFIVEELCYLKTTVFTNNKVYEYNSLNEIVIRNNDLSVLKCKVNIDNNFLEDFVGDGLIISTPTGSTAYNMSLGGAIIDNSLKVLSIMPIAPINNRVFKTFTNPIIIPEKNVVSITFSNKTSLFIMSDGKKHDIDNVYKMECRVLDSIKCLRMKDYNFINEINKKIKN